MAVRDLLGGGSVIVRRMRGFAMANDMVRGDVRVVVTAAFASSSVALLTGMSLSPGTQMRVVRPPLLSNLCRIDYVPLI